METNRIHHGDCLEVLKTMPDNSIDCCITSPPYWGLRDYGTATWEGGRTGCDHKPSNKPGPNASCGNTLALEGRRPYSEVCGKCGAIRVDDQLGLEKTPEEYVSKMVEVFREVKRALKPEGTLWLNLGDSYFSKPKSNYNGKSLGLQSKNYGTGDTELGYKKQADKFKSLLASGNKSKDLVGIPWMVAFALRADGWYLRQDIIWHKPNPMPESVTDRCTKSHEYIFLMAKSQKYYFDNEAIKEPSIEPARAREKNNGESAVDTKTRGHDGNCGNTGTRNKRSVWTVTTKPFKEAHFATFPEDLIRPCILAGCPEGGIVLDPFFGAGTTGLVAVKNNRKYKGIELNPDYIEIAKKRIEPEEAQIRLNF